jgi:hypothetical protein
MVWNSNIVFSVLLLQGQVIKFNQRYYKGKKMFEGALGN